jgi:hypothetical protein
MLKKLLPLTLTFLAATSQADEVNNRAYSFIGFGFGELSYTEGGTLSSGVKFETNPKTTNLFNYSGGYTPINKRAGFYINTTTTLSSSTVDEYWNANGTVTNGNLTNSVNGPYQSNQTSSTHNELDILLGYLIAPGHQVLLGGSYVRTLMDRNTFSNGSALDDFNNAHLTPAVGNVDVLDVGAEDTNNNGTLELDELKAYYGVSPQDSIVNFTETFTSVVAQVGYLYDSRFATRELGMRWLGGVTLGVPLYYDVVNTSNPTISFTDALNGYNLKAHFGAGWRFTRSVGVVAKVDYYLRERDETRVDRGFSEELQRSRSAIIPENEVQYYTFSATVFWNFD